MNKLSLLILTVTVVLTACTTKPTVGGYIACEKQRPTACRAEDNPVCATRATGLVCVRAPCPGAMEKITYENACAGCKDKKVTGYTPGKCSRDNS
ncbi:MAG: hypothetical protein OEZ39_15590 [Gammaproteobacteria bacterium]|nr:hypothetical protein [Gammaproteobacteria bacterium]MDH5653279.1 hypothetical protein [Gammaproteobacteria bacterium]